MTNTHVRKLRTLFGWAAMFGALCITALTGYKAHMNTIRETNRLSARQEILYGIMASEEYPLVVMDSNANVIEWNDAMENLTGISKQTAKQKGLSVIMCDPLKRDAHNKGFKAAFDNPELHSKLTIVNCKMKGKSGEPIPVRISVRIVCSPEGKTFALARIDPEKNIVEFGKRATPSPPEIKK